MKSSSNLENEDVSSAETQPTFECSYCKRVPCTEVDKCNFKLCSGCHKVHYCNQECQLADRKKHKLACKLVINKATSTKTILKEDLHTFLSYCKNGDFEGLQRLISQGLDVNALSKEQLFTTLTCLVGDHLYECAELLLQHNANPNVQENQFGCTPLFMACDKGCDNGVSFLLEHNANPNLLNYHGYVPLHLACQKGHDKCLSVLLKNNADPNINNGYSPLHFACDHGHDICVSILLQYNANPNIINKNGDSNLHLACGKGHDKCVSLLLQHNTNVNILRNQDGASPLHQACLQGYDKCVFLLLQQAGINIETVAKSGYTPLLTACFSGHLKCAALLVEHGANIHARANVLGSSLLLSCMSRNSNLVAYILSLGVDVNIPDVNGMTPIQYCYTYGLEKCVKLLIRHGADESTMKTPLPANFLMAQSTMKELRIENKEYRQIAKHCDYPDCCYEGNNSQSLLKCSSCKAVYYCSREHQKAHWKEHKKLCKAIKK